MADAVHEQRLNMAVKPNTAMMRVQEVASVPVVATIEVGTVTTGEPGTDASVTNSGTKKEAILDFVIPRGATGMTGDDGTDGATFTPAVSADGVISWTNDGGKDNPAPVSIKGPQGIQGVPGDDYVLTDADKQEIADAVIADGTEATLGDAAADLSLGMTNAAVGQIAKITAVDADGKPTAWSPVDMPSGGAWTLIHEQTLTEAAESYTYELNNVRAAALILIPNAVVDGGWKMVKINNLVVPLTNSKVEAQNGIAFAIDLDAPFKALGTMQATGKMFSTYGISGNVITSLTAGDITEINSIGVATSTLLIAGAKISIYARE